MRNCDSQDDTDICNCDDCHVRNLDEETIRDRIDKVVTAVRDLKSGHQLAKSKLSTKLYSIDAALAKLIDLIEGNNEPSADPLDKETMFGMTLRIDVLRDNFEREKARHRVLRKEWYCQEEHFKKITQKIRVTNHRLERQSVYCTAQGFVLGKMLWKVSATNEYLDVILSRQHHVVAVLQNFSNCLQALVQTYQSSRLDCDADEYQYVVCLAGTIGNISGVPDGRYLILKCSVGRKLFDEMMTNIGAIQTPNGEILKWLILTVIYNLVICTEGQIYAKCHKKFFFRLVECLQEPNSERITALSLKIITRLLANVTDLSQITDAPKCSYLKRLRQFVETTSSTDAQNEAKSIIATLKRLKRTRQHAKKRRPMLSTPDDGIQNIQWKCSKKVSKKDRNSASDQVYSEIKNVDYNLVKKDCLCQERSAFLQNNVRSEPNISLNARMSVKDYSSEYCLKYESAALQNAKESKFGPKLTFRQTTSKRQLTSDEKEQLVQFTDIVKSDLVSNENLKNDQMVQFDKLAQEETISRSVKIKILKNSLGAPKIAIVAKSENEQFVNECILQMESCSQDVNSIHGNPKIVSLKSRYEVKDDQNLYSQRDKTNDDVEMQNANTEKNFDNQQQNFNNDGNET